MQVAKINGVRYSERHRLPYFDPFRMSPVDHMHGFFLNIIKHESQLQLEDTETSGMTGRSVEVLADRLKRLEVPHDIGRLPEHIADPKLSLYGLRAIQWLNYAITYARPCLWNFLEENVCYCFMTLIEACEMGLLIL